MKIWKKGVVSAFLTLILVVAPTLASDTPDQGCVRSDKGERSSEKSDRMCIELKGDRLSDTDLPIPRHEEEPVHKRYRYHNRRHHHRFDPESAS